MNIQTILYFICVLLTLGLTGFLAGYAWRRKALAGAGAYAGMALGESLLALVEILSMTSRTPAQAQFWFNLRFVFTGIIPVLFLIFALEYYGYRGWLSKTLLGLGCIIPALSQVIIWAPGLHGLWVRQDVGFTQAGPFWMSDTSVRIPAVWFLVHSFYSLALLLAGMVVIVLAAWRTRREERRQGLLLAGGALIVLVASLLPVLNLLPPGAANPFIPSIGIGTGLYALAIFRFQFLKRSPMREKTVALPRPEARETRSLTLFIFIFILFASGIGAVGSMSYQNYAEQFRAQVDGQLTAVAALKVNELESWRSERLGDANVFYHNPAFAALVQSCLADPGDGQARAQVQAWLEAVRTGEHYERVFLLDTHGVERMVSPEPAAPVSTYLSGQAVAALGLGQVTFTDFQRDAPGSPISLSLLVPIYAGGTSGSPLGVVVLQVDPSVSLYPFIQEWPAPSSTAETLLVRRDGEDVLFLNTLRFEPNTALTLRIPLTQTQVLAVKAVLGQTGIVEGVDYRGVPAIGYVTAVPGSPWFLVARMDTAEVYAPLQAHLWQTVLFLGVLALAGGAGLLLVWRQQRVRYYRSRFETVEALRRTQEEYQELVENASDGIFIADARGRYVEVNPRGCALLGYTRAEILAKSMQDLVAPEELTTKPFQFEDLQSGKAIISERRMIHKDGRLVPVEISAKTLPDGRLQGIVRDISERKQAEQQLIASEVRYRCLFEAARDGILILEADSGVVMDANPFLVEMLGFPQEEIIGKQLWELGFFKDIAASQANFLELQQKGYIRYENLPLETADGRKLYVEFVSNVYQVDHHKVVQCNIRDISGRIQAEERLKSSQERVQALNELQGRLLQPNPVEQKLKLVTETIVQALGADFARIWVIKPGDRCETGCMHAQVTEGPHACRFRERCLHLVSSSGRYTHTDGRVHGRVPFGIYKIGLIASGEIASFLTNAVTTDERVHEHAWAKELGLVSFAGYRLVDPNGTPLGVLALFSQKVISADEDIFLQSIAQATSQVLLAAHADEALRESELTARMLLDLPTASIMLLTPEGLVIDCNETLARRFGQPRTVLLGRHAAEFFPAEVAARRKSRFAEAVATGQMVRWEDSSGDTWLDNLFIPIVDQAGKVTKVIGCGYDISAQKRAEQQLAAYNEKLEETVDERTHALKEAQEKMVRQERLATLGQLAGSVGHELRNPLGVISNAVYFLKMTQPEANDTILEYLDIIDKETRISDKIVTDLLDFTRIKSVEREPADVSELVRQTLERYPAPDPIKVVLDIPADLPMIYADSRQVVQVLGNLVTNACQAIDDIGQLTLSAKEQSGGMISISVQDTGAGILPENMGKLFEPLFTTKLKGIGLGLAVSQKLTEANGGRIEVQSKPGEGSTFTVYLPVYVGGKTE
ncbi:MAG: PAS domain S-box protein [Anaerolineales bacterium]